MYSQEDKYESRLGLTHQKEVFNGEPSDNNGWLHTAVAYALGFSVDRGLLSRTFRSCIRDRGMFTIDRLPNRDITRPPFSVDELMGMVSLLILRKKTAEERVLIGNYRWTRALAYNWKVVLKDFWYLAGKHRNTIWKEQRLGAYRIAFAAPIHHRYYLKWMLDEKRTVSEAIFFSLYRHKTIAFGDDAELVLLWLQLENMGHLNPININKHLLEVYPSDHPFNNLGATNDE